MWSWTIQFLTATDYPSIVSLSYGLPELDQCGAFYPSDCYGVDYRTYIHLVDKQFMKVSQPPTVHWAVTGVSVARTVC